MQQVTQTLSNICIYGLLCPITMQVRYVGKSKNPRARYLQHTRPSDYNMKGPYRRYWIKSLMSQGIRSGLIILEKTDESSWEAREIHWINFLRTQGHKLTNIAAGGNGDAGHTGRKHSKEAKQKMSKAHKGQVAWNIGKKMSAKTKQKLSKALKGKPGSNRGRVFSADARKRMSIAHKDQISWAKGRKMPEETKRKIAEGLRKYNQVKRTNIKDK